MDSNWTYLLSVCLTILCITIFPITQCGRILLSPDPCTSHTLYFTIVGKELVQRGHEVYMILTPKFDYPKSVDEAGIKVLTWEAKDPEIYDLFQETFLNLAEDSIENEPNTIQGLWEIQDMEISLCTNLLRDQRLFKKLKVLNFDLAIGDGLPFWRCANVLFYRLGVPFATITTQYDAWLFRNPALPSFVPFPQGVSFTEKMSFTERLQNLRWLIEWAVFPSLNTMDDSLVSKYAPEKPDISMVDLARQSLLWLINAHAVLEYPRPSLPNMVNIGGLTTKEPKPLPPELEQLASQSLSGTIVVSFGSLVGELPTAITKKLLKAFSQLEQTVVWKYLGSPMMNVPKNVHPMKWIPQNDILGHNNTRLFITHCGNNGQFESMFNGVPMIGMPVFAEQFYNAKKMEYKGYGIAMHLKSFTAEELVASIKTIIQSPKYAQNIRKAGAIYKSQPQRAKQLAAYWIEHVMQFGAEHLQSYAITMPWYEYVMVDILSFLILSAITILLLIRKLLLIIISFCRHTREATKPKYD